MTSRTVRHALPLFLIVIVAGRATAAKPEPQTPASPAPSAEQLLAQLKHGHPRLLIDAAGFQALRRRLETDPQLKQWDKSLVHEADKLLKAPLPQHVLPDGLRLLSTSRSVLQRSYTLAMAYRLHGDRRHVDRLWEELKTVAEFPDFNPKHFLDTAEMTHALAIAYDWLYDTWSDSQRATIRRAIVELGLKPGLTIYRGNRWWAVCNHNWNQVCNGGMTMGALAVGDEEPQIAGEILHDAIGSVPRAMKSYAPDGGWAEGPGYWGYATTYNVVMLAGLQSALGSDFGLSETPGFDQTGLFPLYLTGPTGRCFNFSDSGDHAGRSDCLFWLASRFHQPVDSWFALQSGKPSAAAMIWYRDPGKDPVAAGLPLDKYWRHDEVAVFRGDWNDPRTTFVAIQAGSNARNHAHLDLGSFVLDALGQRWAVDLGPDDYNLPGYFGKSRYDYYRLRAEGHNTLVIDPDKRPDQDPKAAGSIRRFESKPDRAFAIADLTPAYAQHASHVQRGIALLDRRSVLVQDEIVAKQAEVWWFLHTQAEIVLSDDGRLATLSQGKEKLQVRIVSPEALRFEIRPAEPLSSSPHPTRQGENSKTRKLAIRCPKVDQLRLAVLLVPVDGKAEVAAPPIRPLAKW
jgi:hypothetical protein